MGVAPTRSQTSLRRPRRSASSRGRNTQLELLIQKFRNILVQDDAALAPAATSHFPSVRGGLKRNVVSVIDTKGFRDGEVWVSANPREEDNGGLPEVSERNCCGFAGNAFNFYPKHIGCDLSLTRKWHHRQRRPQSRFLTSSAQSLLEADADEIKGSSFVITLRKSFSGSGSFTLPCFWGSCRTLLDSTCKRIAAEGRPRNRGKSTSELWRHARCLGRRPLKRAASTRVCTQMLEFSATPDDDPEVLAASAEPGACPAVAER